MPCSMRTPATGILESGTLPSRFLDSCGSYSVYRRNVYRLLSRSVSLTPDASTKPEHHHRQMEARRTEEKSEDRNNGTYHICKYTRLEHIEHSVQLIDHRCAFPISLTQPLNSSAVRRYFECKRAGRQSLHVGAHDTVYAECVKRALKYTTRESREKRWWNRAHG